MQNGRIWAINQGVKFFILGPNVHNPRGANGLQPFYVILRVITPITKKTENNVFEGMTCRFYILLLFDFVYKVDFQNKQKNVLDLNYV